MIPALSLINAILEADADGTLHLPLPEELRQAGKIKVMATLKVANEGSLSAPKATPEMLHRRKEALERLRRAGGLATMIPNPREWQREIREDRALPGRD